jgi:hypothetical protein
MSVIHSLQKVYSLPTKYTVRPYPPLPDVDGDTREKVLEACPKQHLQEMRNLFNKHYLL